MHKNTKSEVCSDSMCRLKNPVRQGGIRQDGGGTLLPYIISRNFDCPRKPFLN
jgi:hypothetical protein